MSSQEPSMSVEKDTELIRLQQSIDQRKVQRAEELSLGEKLRLGADLYDDGIRWLKHIIKAEHPDWSDEQIVHEIDRRRLIKRRIEEAGRYRVATEEDLRGNV